MVIKSDIVCINVNCDLVKSDVVKQITYGVKINVVLLVDSSELNWVSVVCVRRD